MANRKVVTRKPLVPRSNPPKQKFGQVTYPENRPGWPKPVKLKRPKVGPIRAKPVGKPVRLKRRKRK